MMYLGKHWKGNMDFNNISEEDKEQLKNNIRTISDIMAKDFKDKTGYDIDYILSCKQTLIEKLKTVFDPLNDFFNREDIKPLVDLLGLSVCASVCFPHEEVATLAIGCDCENVLIRMTGRISGAMSRKENE